MRPLCRPAAGLPLGGLAWVAFAVLGLSALLLASAEAYTILKLAGAACLIWLGIQTLRSSTRRHDHAAEPDALGSRPMSARRAFVLGLASDLLNVKVAAFYVTFLTQFITPVEQAGWRAVLLGLLFNVLASSWWLTYILLIYRVGTWLTRDRVRRAIERVSGTTLVGVGAGVALEG